MENILSKPKEVHDETIQCVRRRTDTIVATPNQTQAHDATMPSIRKTVDNNVAPPKLAEAHDETQSNIQRTTDTNVGQQKPTEVHDESLPSIRRTPDNNVAPPRPREAHDETLSSIRRTTDNTVSPTKPTEAHDETLTNIQRTTDNKVAPPNSTEARDETMPIIRRTMDNNVAPPNPTEAHDETLSGIRRTTDTNVVPPKQTEAHDKTLPCIRKTMDTIIAPPKPTEVHEETFQCVQGKMDNDNFAPLKSKEVQNETLSEYFEYLLKEKLCFKRPQQEVDDITEAVIEMVNKLLDEVAVVDERFEKLRVLFVGSMSEGTRNKEPDEFDFIVVIKSLSTSDDIRLRRGCKNTNLFNLRDEKGYAHIEINENAIARFQTDQKYYTCEKEQQRRKVVGRFWSTFRLVLEAAMYRVMHRTYRKIIKPTGILLIPDWFVIGHGPACLCRFVWISSNTEKCPKYLDISVDITPAIQVGDVESVIDRKDVDSEMFQLLTDTGGCLLVAPWYIDTPLTDTSRNYGTSRNYFLENGMITCCFKLAFTNAEIKLMKALTNTHRTCYRILKYYFHVLNPTLNENIVFHSYALKTLVINHDRENVCNESESGCIAKCVLSILEQVEKCIALGSPFYSNKFSLGNVFVPSLNIFENDFESYIVQNTLERIKEIRASLDEISNVDISNDEQDRHNAFKKVKIFFL